MRRWLRPGDSSRHQGVHEQHSHTSHHVVSVVTPTLISHLVPQGGIYLFQLMDNYTAVQSLVFLAFCEVVAVSWIFGKKKKTCWTYLRPDTDNIPMR